MGRGPGDVEKVRRSRLLSLSLILNTYGSFEEKSRCSYVLQKDILPDKGASLNCHLVVCI